VAEVTREKAKLAAILRTVIDGLLVIDGKGRLVLANPAAEEILAFDAASAIGRPIREIVRDERLLVLFTQTVESGVGAQADVSLDDARGLAGGARIMHTRTAAMRSGTGPVRGVVAILQDVTKLRLAERAKSEFVSNVSHELRTPISIMKVGLSNLIRYQDIAAEQRQSLLETISRENHRLEVLISDLLDVSCIEAGSFALRRAEFDLREVVTDVAESLRARADEARLELEATVSAQPVRVLGDRDKLRQVVMNLAVNAIHYTPAAGGRVQLSCRLTEGAALPRAEIQVRDTGVGMPSNVVPHIFERFYRGHASQLTTVPGTGLGLAIVKEIVDAHGGEIRVESRVNEGSTFTVILPASGALPAPA
jgi:two-component system phosphate regulon sensor histidine kinase PhoR